MQPQGEFAPGASWEDPSGVVLEFANAGNVNAPALKTLFAHWLAISAGRFAPSRDDIDPRNVPALLPNIHMYDVRDGGVAFQARLIGTQIVAAIGEDQTRRILTRSESDLMGARMFAVLSAVVTHKRSIHCTAKRAAAPHKSFLSSETLCLPLSQDSIEVDKILACTIYAQPQNLFSPVKKT